MAFILTILMRKYRNPVYSNEKNHAFYAPLIRRAFAEMIDIIIVLLPLIIIFIFIGVFISTWGFGRAFLRNILRFIDGFFNYLVGILIIAFTDNQQRVGDMAARTIVIKKQDK